MKKLVWALLIVAGAFGIWTYGMTYEQRQHVKAKLESMREWSPISLSH